MSGKDSVARRVTPSTPTFTFPAARRLFVLRKMRDRAVIPPKPRAPAPTKSA